MSSFEKPGRGKRHLLIKSHSMVVGGEDHKEPEEQPAQENMNLDATA